MAWVQLVTMLALLEYFGFAYAVGSARGRYGVKAPATTGNENFERYFRVQQNTLETLVAFIPGISLFALFVDPNWAAWIGLVYVVGRVVYFRSYVADPAKRGPGFLLSLLSIATLLVGGLVGALRNL